MRLSDQAWMMEMRGVHLLMLPPADGRGQQALQVNESFAFLWERFRKADSFSSGDVAEALADQYGLEADEAAVEAGRTIELWDKWKLLIQ